MGSVTMKIYVNGESMQTTSTTLAELLQQLDYRGATLATAVDGVFVPRAARDVTALAEDMEIEIVSPVQGG